MGAHAATSQEGTAISAETNEAIVRRFIQAVQNEGDLAAIDGLCAPDFVNHSAPPCIPPTREGLAQLTALFRQAFPDGRMAIVRLVDGRIAEHWNAVDNLGMLQQLGAIAAPKQAS